MVVANLKVSNRLTKYRPSDPEGSFVLRAGSFALIRVSSPKQFKRRINTGMTKSVAYSPRFLVPKYLASKIEIANKRI